MRSKIINGLSLLLTIPFIFTILIVPAGADSNAEVLMPYKQFSLIEASEPVIPKYPLGNDFSLAEEGEALARFDEWWNAKYEQLTAFIPNLDKVQSFTRNSMKFFFDNVGDSNAVYSPINIWFYLQLLSILTEGNSRKQVLDAMGLDAEFSSYNDKDLLYKALYWNDGRSVWHPAFSLWLDRQIHLSDALAKNLATNHHTSVFQGPMGENVYDEAFHAWLNEKTNSLMQDIVNDLGFDRSTSISLCTSLYLRCPWSLPFDKDSTYQDIFYSHEGEINVDYMMKEESGGTIYQGDGFSSVIMDLQDGGYVTLVLPDSDKDINDILISEELFAFLFASREWANTKSGRVKISMPKIDIMTAMPLKKSLLQLGVVDIFDAVKAEFSKDISFVDNFALNSVDQYSRLIMNEDGVEAASIIVSDVSSMQVAAEEEIEFILNRPFIFAVFSETNIPLFFGIYNTA